MILWSTDLLQFNPEMYGGKKTNAAAGYNRSDWFYLEDNRIEDEEKKAEEKRHVQVYSVYSILFLHISF